MSADPHVTILIPAFDEAASLPELHRRITEAMASGPSYEIIVVDDGSTDDTWAVLDGLRASDPRLTALRHLRNEGKSMALMQGFDLARGQVLITMDADLQDHPEAIPTLLAKLDEGYDLVGGWRVNRVEGAGKVAVSRLFNRLTSRFLKCPLHDINCGFKAMRREIFTRLNLRGDLHRLIPALAIRDGFRVAEVPVPHSARKHGSSKYRLLRFNGLVDLLAVKVSFTTRSRPFHFSCRLGLAFLTLGVASLVGFFSWRAESPSTSLWLEVARNLLGALGAWACFTGTILPLFGFHLEVLLEPMQDAKWRSGLLRDRRLSDR